MSRKKTGLRKKVQRKLRLRLGAGILAGFLILLGGIFVGEYLWKGWGRAVNVHAAQEEDGAYYLYIPTGSTFDDVVQYLCEAQIIQDCSFFRWLARQMNYPAHVYPGRYRITPDMGYVDLIRKLRSGTQDPLRLTWLRFRTLEQVAEFFGKHLEPDARDFLETFQDESFLATVNLTPYTVLGIFIPNTYEFYWTTTPEQLVRRMVREFESFWDEERRKKARELGLTPMEVVILASIVEEETWRDDEKPRIAGVYLNRLRKGMKLQADPTVRYALGDFSIRRITYAMTRIPSPYNTYHIYGLPPGPICTPSPQTIDAVLNAEEHDFLFFVARPDGSGYHMFSRTYEEHLQKARLYHQMLREKGIR